MKRIIITSITAGLLISAQAIAGSFTIDEVQKATTLALEDFQKVQPDHASHFVGFKSWISGEDAKVKIYVTHDGMNMEFNYQCHKHDADLECHAQ